MNGLYSITFQGYEDRNKLLFIDMGDPSTTKERLERLMWKIASYHGFDYMNLEDCEERIVVEIAKTENFIYVIPQYETGMFTPIIEFEKSPLIEDYKYKFYISLFGVAVALAAKENIDTDALKKEIYETFEKIDKETITGISDLIKILSPILIKHDVIIANKPFSKILSRIWRGKP